MQSLTYPDPVLKAGAVTLRPWEAGDGDCVRQASGDPRIVDVTTVPPVYTPEEGAAFIYRQHNRLVTGEGVSLAICSPDPRNAVGLVILSARPQAGVAGIGYWVVPAARRAGIATTAIGLITDWGLTGAGFARVEAWVDPSNTPSILALQDNGFAVEGRLRSFLTSGTTRSDVLVLSRVTSS